MSEMTAMRRVSGRGGSSGAGGKCAAKGESVSALWASDSGVAICVCAEGWDVGGVVSSEVGRSHPVVRSTHINEMAKWTAMGRIIVVLSAIWRRIRVCLWPYNNG